MEFVPSIEVDTDNGSKVSMGVSEHDDTTHRKCVFHCGRVVLEAQDEIPFDLAVSFLHVVATVTYAQTSESEYGMLKKSAHVNTTKAKGACHMMQVVRISSWCVRSCNELFANCKYVKRMCGMMCDSFSDERGFCPGAQRLQRKTDLTLKCCCGAMES